jgi:hypothetical protein
VNIPENKRPKIEFTVGQSNPTGNEYSSKDERAKTELKVVQSNT